MRALLDEFHMFGFKIVAIAICIVLVHCNGQDNMPSFFTGMLAPDTTTPVHTYSLNMAVLGLINGVTEGFGVVLFRYAEGCEYNRTAPFHSVPFLFA